MKYKPADYTQEDVGDINTQLTLFVPGKGKITLSVKLIVKVPEE